MKMQQTISKNIFAQGIGLHSGHTISVALKPAPAGSGVNFQRTDLSGAKALAAKAANVTSTALATTLGEPGRPENRISTVEHLMSALAAFGLDNILVEADGPELPIFDGSAAKWVELLQQAGLTEQNAPKRRLKVGRYFKAALGDRYIEVRPASRFSVEAYIDFGGCIGRHCFYYVESEKAFRSEISRSRTFCLLKDVELMHSRGLALGGSLENAVVVGDEGILNPEGLRYQDEFVRHKILDFIGDLAMAGAPVVGHFILHKPGHELNRHFLAEALAEPGLLEEESAAQKKSSLRKELRPLRPLSPLALDEAWPNPIAC